MSLLFTFTKIVQIRSVLLLSYQQSKDSLDVQPLYSKLYDHHLLTSVLWLLALCLLFLSSTMAMADTIEKLLMPGPLISGHAKYENACKNCHQPMGHVSQRTLCLDCHKKINQDIVSKQGFHAKNPAAKEQECRSCHTDHIGRKAKTVLLNQQAFDHDLTDFSLKGHHQQLECQACHTRGKKFRSAPHACVACHKKEDVHHGEQGKQCQDCHNENQWSKTRFNHNKTKFKLRGKHLKTDCLACHVTQSYTQAPTQCIACHKVNDVHNRSLGTQCQDCHNESRWSSVHFDHNKTHYPLTGKHQHVACHACHTTNSLKEKLPKTCIGCHASDDIHSGRNGQKCQQCHTTQNWKTKFNHNKTDFPLHGAHKNIPCLTCHQGALYKQQLPTQCFSCHQQDDVHQQSQGKDCQRCHNESSWQKNILFDHDITHFPLVGLHASVSCDECHISEHFKETQSRCIACHKADDIHKTTLGQQCAQCHNPGGWAFWQFNHDKQTQFKLTGKHRNLACHACHTQPVKANELKLPNSCISCHRKDDVHQGQFGQNCQHCHDTDSFEHFTFTTRH